MYTNIFRVLEVSISIRRTISRAFNNEYQSILRLITKFNHGMKVQSRVGATTKLSSRQCLDGLQIRVTERNNPSPEGSQNTWSKLKVELVFADRIRIG